MLVEGAVLGARYELKRFMLSCGAATRFAEVRCMQTAGSYCACHCVPDTCMWQFAADDSATIIGPFCCNSWGVEIVRHQSMDQALNRGRNREHQCDSNVDEAGSGWLQSHSPLLLRLSDAGDAWVLLLRICVTGLLSQSERRPLDGATIMLLRCNILLSRTSHEPICNRERLFRGAEVANASTPMTTGSCFGGTLQACFRSSRFNTLFLKTGQQIEVLSYISVRPWSLLLC
jgi:hypothetical protein